MADKIMNKLIKYEFRSMVRKLGMIWIVVPAMAIFSGIIICTYNHVGRAESLGGMAQLLFKVLPICGFATVLIALVVVTLIIVVSRFYEGMTKDEGYLMHTLPVKTWQLIASKGIVATAVIIIGMVIGGISTMICFAFNGNLVPITFREIFEAIEGAPILLAYIIEIIILAIMYLLTEIYKIYTAISMGQLRNKHRGAIMVASYIGINFVLSIVGSIAMVVVSVDAIGFRVFAEGIVAGMNITENTIAQCMIFAAFIIYAMEIAIFHFATERILNKKLNLE